MFKVDAESRHLLHTYDTVRCDYGSILPGSQPEFISILSRLFFLRVRHTYAIARPHVPNARCCWSVNWAHLSAVGIDMRLA